MKKYILIILSLFSLNILAQEQKKDTLFIKHNDKLLLKKYVNSNNNLINYPLYGTPNDYSVYFVEVKTYHNLEVKHPKYLKDVFKKSAPYNINGRLRIDFVVNKLSKYVTFIIDGNKYSKVYLEEAIQ